MIDQINSHLAGDPRAFHQLFEKYKNLVFQTALLVLGDPKEAEDALQEVFLRVYHSLHTYDNRKGAFSTWLHKITVNYCLNTRRRNRIDMIPLDEVERLSRGMDCASVEDLLIQDEDLHWALQKLSQKSRTVVVMRCYWNLPYVEIGEVLDIPVGTVQSRLNHAFNKLRALMEEANSSHQFDRERRDNQKVTQE